MGDKIEADNCFEIPRELPRPMVLGSRLSAAVTLFVQQWQYRAASHFTSCAAVLTTVIRGRTKGEDKAMEGKGDGYQMELGRGSDKEDRGREKGPGRQREHR